MNHELRTIVHVRRGMVVCGQSSLSKTGCAKGTAFPCNARTLVPIAGSSARKLAVGVDMMHATRDFTVSIVGHELLDLIDDGRPGAEATKFAVACDEARLAVATLTTRLHQRVDGVDQRRVE
eukprot:SAG31_NODE_1174_length_9538_cov_3.152453_13_plen_122_part_00